MRISHNHKTMDTKTGEIMTPEQRKILESLPKLTAIQELEARFKEMKVPPTPEQMARTPVPRVEPYEPCPCGSGKKFKFCCRSK